jgi:WD40 repeat protein
MRCAVLLILLLAGPARAADVEVSWWDHRDKVQTLAFSTDGKTIFTATGESPESANFWDRHTLKRRGTLETGEIKDAKFSPDGKWLITVEAKKHNGPWQMIVRDPTSGKPIRHLDLKDFFLREVLFRLPHGHLAIHGQSSLQFWDPATGKILDEWREELDLRAIVPDGNTLAVVKEVGILPLRSQPTLWDLPSRKEKQSFLLDRGGVMDLAFSPDGKLLAAGISHPNSHPGETRVWDVATGKVALASRDFNHGVGAVAFSPDGTTLAAGEDFGRVKLWDLARLREAGEFNAPSAISKLIFSPDSRLLAAIASSRGVILWDPETRRELVSPGEQESQRQQKAERDRAFQALERELTPDRRREALGAGLLLPRLEDNLLMRQAQDVWEQGRFIEAERLLEQLRPRPGQEDLRGFEWHYLRRQLPRRLMLLEPVHGEDCIAAISSDRRYVAAALAQGLQKTFPIKLLDATTGKVVTELEGHTRRLGALAFSPDGSLLAAGEGQDGKQERAVKLWDVKERKARRTLGSHPDRIRILVFSPDGRVLASASDTMLKLWDLEDGRERFVRAASRAGYWTAIAFSRDGRILATGSSNEETRLWDPATGDEKGTLVGVRGASSIAFAPNTSTVATLHTATVVLWDLRTNKSVASFRDASGPLLFVEDGQFLLAGLSLHEPLTGRVRLFLDVRYDPRSPSPRRPEVRACTSSPEGRLTMVIEDEQGVHLFDGSVRPRSLHFEDARFAHDRLAFSADAQALLAANDHGSLDRWDVSTRRRVSRVDAVGDRDVPRVMFRKEAPPMVRIDKQEIPLVDYPAVGGEATLGEGKVRLLALSPDARTLVAGRVPTGEKRDMTVTLHETATGREFARLPPSRAWLQPAQLGFSADGKILVTWARDVISWDARTGREVSRLKPPGLVKVVRFGAEGRGPAWLLLLRTQGRRTLLDLWDVATGQVRGTLHGLGDDLWEGSAAISPDGRLVATGGNSEVRLWDATTGHLRFVLRGHDGPVVCVAWRSDGRALAATGNNKVTLWTIADE